MSELKRITALPFLIACAVCVSEKAMAEPITYTFSGTILAGSIGTTSLTNQPFVVTVNSDTSDVTSFTSPIGTTFTTPPNQAASITLAGIGTARITDGATVSDLHNAESPSELDLGVGSAQSIWFGLGDPAFATYDLTAAIGPIGELSNSTSASFDTSLGNAVIVELDSGPATFTAQLSGSAVPEPSSLVMAVTAILGLSTLGLSHKRRGERRHRLDGTISTRE